MNPATPPAVDCSVLTPVLDEELHIEATIRAMRVQDFVGRVEFIFADGGSSDRTRDLIAAAAAEDDRLVLVDNPRRSVTSGLNVALAHARGRWVARMDAHARYPPHYLSEGVARLARGDTPWVSGPQHAEGANPVSRGVALALRSALGQSGSRRWADSATDGDEYELDSGVFCGVWERDTLLEFGGWDERWRVNEDSEMAARFLERGHRLVCVPRMTASYTPRNTLQALWVQYERYGRYRVRTAAHHPETLRRQHLAAPVLIAVIAAAFLAPSPIRHPARAAAVLYASLLASQGCRAFHQGAPALEATLVPVALATMQLGWGVGTWRGYARYGVPRQAIWRALRR